MCIGSNVSPLIRTKCLGVGSRTLKFHDCDVAYMGVRGATVDSLRTQAVLREVRRTSPDVVILHVGGGGGGGGGMT